VYFNLGVAYEQLGLKEEALVSYRKALELRPGWEQARKRVADQ
jgi:Flp pilus assembly protein TadD